MMLAQRRNVLFFLFLVGLSSATSMASSSSSFRFLQRHLEGDSQDGEGNSQDGEGNNSQDGGNSQDQGDDAAAGDDAYDDYGAAVAASATPPPSLRYHTCVGNEAYFRLCSEGCGSSCSHGTEYVARLNFFTNVFVTTHIQTQQYACAVAQQNCGDISSSDKDECYVKFGVADSSSCWGGGDDDGNNNNDAANRVSNNFGCASFDNTYFYTGALCHNGVVYRGLYTDEFCTTMAPKDTFESMFGVALPNSVGTGSPLVARQECAYCTGNGAYANGNNNNNDDVQYTYQQEQVEPTYDLYKVNQCEALSTALSAEDTYSGLHELNPFMRRNKAGAVLMLLSAMLLGAGAVYVYHHLRSKQQQKKKDAGRLLLSRSDEASEANMT